MAEGDDLTAGGGGKKKLFVILLLLLVIVFSGVVGYYAYQKYFQSSDDIEMMVQPGSPMEDKLQDSTPQSEALLENPVFSPPLSFTVNLRDGKRYLKVTVRGVFENPEAINFLVNREAMVKDAIITTLQNKTTEDLRDHNGILNLKRDLKRKLNNIYDAKYFKDSGSKDLSPVKRILFEEFLLQ